MATIKTRRDPTRDTSKKTQLNKYGKAAASRPLPPKLTLPRAKNLFARERLFDVLDRVRRDHRVTWVSAPGGAGKTSLATSYISTRKLPVLWYQIDAGDGDVASFFHYLSLAAARAAPRYKHPLPALTPEYFADLPTFTRNFFRALYSRLRATTVVVLDNYQDALEASPLHDVLHIAMTEVPDGIHLMVLSRVEPPTVLARLRLCDHAACLDWSKLRLTPDESVGLSTLRLGKNVLSTEFLTTLHQRTQGWAAGLVLMLEQARSGVWNADATLSDQKLMFEYFAGEILHRNEPAVRDFLLKTALLPKISVADAQALTGVDNANDILDDLTRRNYFTVRHVGTSGDTFEYHPLFREFLKSQLLQTTTSPDIAALCCHAASLAEAAGDIEGAVMLWHEAKAWDELTRCLCGSAPMLLKQGRNKILIAWIDAIPPVHRDSRPWLLFWRGHSCSVINPAEARTHFERAHVEFLSRQERDGTLLAWAGIVDAIIHEYDDTTRLDPWIEWLNTHLVSTPGLPAETIGFRVTSSMAVALMFRRDRQEQVRPWIERASMVLEQLPDLSARCRLAVYLALYATWVGDLNRLETLVQNIQRWGQQVQRGSRLGIEAQYANYVASLHEWIAGISDYGLQVSNEALVLIEESGIRILAHHMEARAIFGALCNGALAEAKAHLDRLKHMATATPSSRQPWFQYHYLPGWYSLLAGDAAKALLEAENSLRLGRETGLSAFHRGFSNIVAAHALLDMRRQREAQLKIETVIEIAREFGSPILEFSGLLLKAKSDLASNDASCNQPGLAELRQALALGKRCNFLNTVVWYPATMAALCRIALSHNIETDYVRALIKKRGLLPPTNGVIVDTWPFPVKIYTFGRFAVVRDEAPLKFSSKTQKKTLDLLKALIALGGRDVTEQKLSDVLWPDADSEQARQNFKVTLHRLRGLIGNESVLLRDSRLTLDPCRVWVDVWAFERSTSEGLKHVRSARFDAANNMLECAHALYHGTFLADNEQMIALQPRERLRGKLIGLIAELAHARLRDEDYYTSVTLYRKGLDVDALKESFYQGLIRCYRMLEQPAEALKTYERCRKILKTELGLGPAQETEALMQGVRE